MAVVSAFEDSEERRFLDGARTTLGKSWCTDASCSDPETLPPSMQSVIDSFVRLSGGRERILLTVAMHPGLLGPAPAALVLCEQVYRSCESNPTHPLAAAIQDLVRRHAESLSWTSIVVAPDPAHIRVALHFSMQWVRDRKWFKTARLGNAVGIKLRGCRLCYDCGSVLEGDANLQRHRAEEHAGRGRSLPSASSTAPSAPSVPFVSSATTHSHEGGASAAAVAAVKPPPYAYDPTDPYGTEAPPGPAPSYAPQSYAPQPYEPQPYAPTPAYTSEAPKWSSMEDPTGAGREAYDPFA